MKRNFYSYLSSGMVLLCLLFVSGSFSVACAESSNKTIASYDAKILGVKLHYTMAGHGPTIILLHGYAETSRMWDPDPAGAGAAIYRDRAGLAWHRRVGDSGRRS